MYANVIVDAPGLDQTFTYGIPPELEDAVRPGVCVAVPFGGREHVGYVLTLSDLAPDIGEIKDISAIVPDAVSLTEPLLGLASRLADYYVTSLGQAVRAIVPEAMSGTIATIVRLLDPSQASPSSPKQLKVVEALKLLGGEADADVLRMKARVEDFGVVLRQLRRHGAVEVLRTLDLPKAKPRIVRGVKSVVESEPGDLRRAPKQTRILEELADQGEVRQTELLRRTRSSSSPLRSLVEKGLAQKTDLRVRRRAFDVPGVVTPPEFELTKEQESALGIIKRGLTGEPQTTLLHGVTASGKTEVYLRSIEAVLEQGRTCIALVPEIALTTHLLEAYVSRFGDRMAILHSRLSVGERHDEWRRIESGEAKVVLGPRSAVFAPLDNLGLVVIDEEHEPSYKQENAPRYDARTLAEERARQAGASVILGSATPSIETYCRATSGEIGLATLGSRVDERPLPTVKLVDQRIEFEEGRRNVFSEPLREAIAERLAKREQVMLFINRRGYASFILCRSCGYTSRCSNCDVSYTYHVGPRTLRCHHCNASRLAPTECPTCGSPHIRQFGIGTEKVEEEVRRVFPEASVIRMDRDTTTRKGAHASILRTFREGKADIMVGTQMIAKGLDFPNVTLVGVISADTILHLPDFRAPERTFQLLTQVSGRAGRGDIPGEVVVQSFSPDHYAIQAAACQDYLSFYNQEIEHRRELSYPPFSRLVNIISSDPIEETAEERIRAFAREITVRLQDGRGHHQPSAISHQPSVDILGPAPAPLAKLKGLYRWHLTLRDRGSGGLQGLLRGVMAEIPQSVRTGIVLDVDPLTML